MATAVRLQKGIEERFTAALMPGPRLGSGLGKGSGALQDTVPPSLFSGAPVHPLAQG